jgi:hypothetical protein
MASLDQLENAHLRMLDLFSEHPTVATEVLAKCVPQLVGIVEERVPHVAAVILRRDDVRELVTQVVLDVLRVQADAARPPRRRARLP